MATTPASGGMVAKTLTRRRGRQRRGGRVGEAHVRSPKAAAGTKPSFEAGTPLALFDAHMAPSASQNVLQYDVTADGKRLLIDRTNASDAASSPPLRMVTNWNAAVKK
jgi:hypothetical protein